MKQRIRIEGDKRLLKRCKEEKKEKEEEEEEKQQ